jgi:hypothetical protein
MYVSLDNMSIFHLLCNRSGDRRGAEHISFSPPASKPAQLETAATPCATGPFATRVQADRSGGDDLGAGDGEHATGLVGVGDDDVLEGHI